MSRKPVSDLRTGFTTGACATAAAKAAVTALLGRGFTETVTITLPRGQTPSFSLVEAEQGEGWALAAVQKDAGDDPDVTHDAVIRVTVRPAAEMRFVAGTGVGKITKPGLPIPPGEAAINPVPRQMIEGVLREVAGHANFEVEVSVPGGAELAKKTWNPRLGIVGGISILGTTGIVRPFSCSAWIASIHRGIDVARATGVEHAVGSTGATSERVAQDHFGLPDHAMLDMGDFVGGMLKYLAKHPIPRVTIAGGFGKMVKLAQGAADLHSSRSQVDFAALAEMAGVTEVSDMNTAAQALELVGEPLAAQVAEAARNRAVLLIGDAPMRIDVMVIDRQGKVVAAT